MKATGIVRRIDDLGRVVIPKEIRKTMRIKDGESLEIYTGRDGEIILKKYSPLNSINDYSDKYCEAIYETTNRPTLITDTDVVISSSGAKIRKDETINLLQCYVKILLERKQVVLTKGSKEFKELYPEFPAHVQASMITPIIKNGDIIGGVVQYQMEGKPVFGDMDKRFGELSANYLANQMQA